MARHFILLRLNPFGLRVDREGWWFEHSMSYLQVCLSAESAKNVSWPWLYHLTSTGKFVYIYIYIYIYNYCIFHGLRGKICRNDQIWVKILKKLNFLVIWACYITFNILIEIFHRF